METAINLLLGVMGSIIATFVLYLCSHLYQFGYKEDFEFELENAFISVYQIENHHLFPDDYLFVMRQMDTLRRCSYNMYKLLKPLSLWKDRLAKKLIVTILYDIINVCEKAEYITVGYDGKKEQEARLEKIHRCFYRLNGFEKNNISTVKIQLEIIKLLIKGEPIYKAFNEIFELYGAECVQDFFKSENLDISGLIGINSFRTENDIGMRKRCFTCKELEEALKSCHYQSENILKEKS